MLGVKEWIKNSDVEEKKKVEASPFSSEELSLLDHTRIPRHVAIAMDGNRRWAKRKQLPYMMGHAQGAETLIEVVSAAAALNIKVITAYTFSTENWNRSPEEIATLMYLYKTYLLRFKERMRSQGVKLGTIGDLSRLPADLAQIIQEVKEATSDCSKIELVLALNYGSRDEIRRAILAILHDIRIGKCAEQEITENLIGKYLDTAKWGDPDLWIRPSGEKRLSNFLLWQLSYAEIYTTDVLWPDFKPKDLLASVLEYQKRERRWGGL